MDLEQRGIPTVTLVTERFVSLATSIARARGVPDLPLLVLPPDVETRSPTGLHDLARTALPDLLQRLTVAGKRPAAL